MIPPRLILLDLDGTLVGSDGHVSDRNAAALRRAADSGAHVVIATARPVRWLAEIRESVPSTVAICSNGGIVIDLGSGAVLRSHLLDGARLLELAERLRAEGAAVAFGVEGLPEIGMLAEEHFPAPDPSDLRRRALADLFTASIVKGLIRTDPADVPTVRSLLERYYADVLAWTHSGTPGLIELSLAGISKGSVIAELAREWGLGPADAVAFGDMPNDIEMLAWAGHSVAVANADPAVKAIATEVGAHCDDHAVARVLERWF